MTDLRRLTSTQRRIVQLIVRGFTYREIGTTINISERTVRWHTRRIRDLLPPDQERRCWSTRRRIRDGADFLLAA